MPCFQVDIELADTGGPMASEVAINVKRRHNNTSTERRQPAGDEMSQNLLVAIRAEFSTMTQGNILPSLFLAEMNLYLSSPPPSPADSISPSERLPALISLPISDSRNSPLSCPDDGFISL